MKRSALINEVDPEMFYSADDVASRNFASTRISLGTVEREELLRLARYITEDPGQDPEGFCVAARRAAPHLPNLVTELLR
jgi:hypothetical protein